MQNRGRCAVSCTERATCGGAFCPLGSATRAIADSPRLRAVGKLSRSELSLALASTRRSAYVIVDSLPELLMKRSFIVGAAGMILCGQGVRAQDAATLNRIRDEGMNRS